MCAQAPENGLQSRWGRDPAQWAWFNYPYGDHDERSERVCERLGLQIAYSTRPPADWVAHEDRFRVPRVDTCFLPVTGDAEPAVLAGEIV